MIEAIEKKDIRKVSLDDLQKFLKEHNEKPFKAKQIYEWLWKKSAKNFQEMTNLSLEIRKILDQYYEFRSVAIGTSQVSNDATVKYAFRLHDKYDVEGVLIPTDTRMTACISSQVGCSLTCKFCATGYMDRKRNLEASEIYDQVVLIKDEAEKRYQHTLTNIVYMGMGEPLLNYQNVLNSVDLITSEKGLGMSPKRITISTAGIAKMIKKLGDDEVKFNLAVSLHAANDEKRNQIMPINESNTLEALKESLLYYYDKTKNKITFEYIVFNDFNDKIQDAKELYEFAKNIPSKINIIEYNPIAQAEFVNAEKDAIDQFAEYLEKRNIVVNVRRSRGKDIDAACGQLAGKLKK